MADADNQQRVDIFDREYQRYSLASRAYMVPVDSVRCSCPYQLYFLHGLQSSSLLTDRRPTNRPQEEETRLEQQNGVLQWVFEDEVFHPSARVACDESDEILDLGFGTGEWAVNACRQFGCKVSHLRVLIARLCLSQPKPFSALLLLTAFTGHCGRHLAWLSS
jgi:hypothetical protein